MTHFTELPPDLPAPVDDGACDHLARACHAVDPAAVDRRSPGRPGRARPGRTVIYCYPRTGRPGEPLPDGWDAIPGARGCTPQSCAFRDHHRELADLGAEVYGLSTQTTDYQREMAERLHLPFEVLSDARFALTDALRLPTFEVDGMRLIKRLTLVIETGGSSTCSTPSSRRTRAPLR